MRTTQNKKPAGATRNTLPDDWKRCGGCGRMVKVPADPRGHGCPKCGMPLSRAREA